MCIKIIQYVIKFRLIKKKKQSFEVKWVYFTQRSQSILLVGLRYVQRGLLTKMLSLLLEVLQRECSRRLNLRSKE